MEEMAIINHVFIYYMRTREKAESLIWIQLFKYMEFMQYVIFFHPYVDLHYVLRFFRFSYPCDNYLAKGQ